MTQIPNLLGVSACSVGISLLALPQVLKHPGTAPQSTKSSEKTAAVLSNKTQWNQTRSQKWSKVFRNSAFSFCVKPIPALKNMEIWRGLTWIDVDDVAMRDNSSWRSKGGLGGSVSRVTGSSLARRSQSHTQHRRKGENRLWRPCCPGTAEL